MTNPLIDTDPDKSRLSVLVVDDQEINLQLMPLLLRELDCAATLAGSGEEAVELAAAAGFDLVLMDLHMAGMDGDEATRKIRAKGASHLAFIATWTTDPPPRLDLGLYDGALVKPLTVEALGEVVWEVRRRVLNRGDARVTPLLPTSAQPVRRR